MSRKLPKTIHPPNVISGAMVLPTVDILDGGAYLGDEYPSSYPLPEIKKTAVSGQSAVEGGGQPVKTQQPRRRGGLKVKCVVHRAVSIPSFSGSFSRNFLAFLCYFSPERLFEGAPIQRESEDVTFVRQLFGIFANFFMCS